MKVAAKLAAMLFILATLVIAPYLAFGAELEGWSQHLVQTERAPAVLFVLVVCLLVLDIFLPIPSSLVCVGAYLVMPGPLAFVAVCGGLTLSYVVGHWLGGRLGTPALMATFNAQELRVLGSLGERNRFMLIAVTRPLPVLAEMLALYLGSVHAPIASSAFAALLANVGVAGLYGVVASNAKTEESLWLMLAASMLLPTLFWAVGRALAALLRAK